MFYVYLLKSKQSDKYYVGSTKDLKQRVHDHNHGLVKSTKTYIPWDLLYYEAYQSESAARVREQILKSHGRTLASLKVRIMTGKSI